MEGIIEINTLEELMENLRKEKQIDGMDENECYVFLYGEKAKKYLQN